MTHPNTIELEAFACGEPAERLVAHLAACEACRGFVDRAQKLAAEVPARPGPAAIPILAAAHRRERRWRVVVSSGVILLSAAAMALLWTGAREAPRPSSSTVALMATAESDTTFKGNLQVAVVRQRGDAQERFTEAVHVRPGDRLRVEVALDRPRAILAGVLDEDGSYLELMTDGVRNAGTHLSDKSARIDARPMHGTIIVGAPEAVRRARTTGKLEGLATLRVSWEDAP